jgi:alpha-D-ribose 1-methylphosphonate 5-triphosphate diphosphatase
VTPDRRIDDGTLRVRGDRIESVGQRPSSADDSIDVAGKYVLPGLVDIHGDDIERHLFPRAEAQVPIETAVRQSERAALGAGVTTKLHALPFENAPDDQRSVHRSTELSRAVRDRRADSPLDQRVHARCELADGASVAAVQRLLSDGDVALVSLMNHTPGDGQYSSTAGLSERFEAQGAVSEDGLEEVIQSRTAVTGGTLARRRDAVLEAADAAGVPVATHDAKDELAVDRAADAGVSICEFPLTLGAARRARERGMTVSMGAPNLVRGGSLWGNLDTRDAIDAGVADVLCSDFRPQTMLQSVFTDTGEPIPARVNRVSAAPAAAVGLSDIGRLESGRRADILVVDPEPTPTVSRVFVGGTEVYRYGSGP